MMSSRDLAKLMIIPVAHLVEAERYIRLCALTIVLLALLMLLESAKRVTERSETAVIFFRRSVMLAEFSNILTKLLSIFLELLGLVRRQQEVHAEEAKTRHVLEIGQ